MSDNNTNETISAKLRRWADDAKKSNKDPFCLAENEMGLGCPSIPCGICQATVFRLIADEIDAEQQALVEQLTQPGGVPIMEVVREIATGSDDYPSLKEAIDRYYLPRPLYEDGEPVYIGAEIDDKKRGKLEVSRICYTDGGFYFNNSRGSNGRKMKGITYKHGERVGRAKQQVLDADGVPIEVGDELWSVEGDGPWTVIAPLVGTGKTLFDDGGCASPDWLTHREPDTQERIDRDATDSPFSHCVKHGLVNGHNYMSDSTELMVLDLLRRQRELDGRDA